MNWTDDSLDKLEKLFEEKYEDIVRKRQKGDKAGFLLDRPDDVYLDFCDRHEIVLIEKEEQRWWLNFNQDHVIVENPEYWRKRFSNETEEQDFRFMAIPKQFAEKCLILGHIPD